MIRKVFVQRKVLELYRLVNEIRYPIDPADFLKFLPKQCRLMSYSRMAEISNCSIEDVATMCGSHTGATHHDGVYDRYLILFNDTQNKGRTLWTQCHEIGHICLGHLPLIKNMDMDMEGEEYKRLEQEADFFAWNLIAPLPIMREMGIRSTEQIKNVFGMSTQAAQLHYDRYINWCHGHVKTAWENNMLRAFRYKGETKSVSCPLN